MRVVSETEQRAKAIVAPACNQHVSAPHDHHDPHDMHASAAHSPHSSHAAQCEHDETCCGAILRMGETPYAQAGAIPSDTLIYKATEIFSALADSTRFKILSALAGGELCVHELVALTEVSQSAVSHQLRLLRDRGLVSTRRDGQRIAYRFTDEHVRSLILIGLEHAAEQEDSYA